VTGRKKESGGIAKETGCGMGCYSLLS